MIQRGVPPPIQLAPCMKAMKAGSLSSMRSESRCDTCQSASCVQPAPTAKPSARTAMISEIAAGTCLCLLAPVTTRVIGGVTTGPPLPFAPPIGASCPDGLRNAVNAPPRRRSHCRSGTPPSTNHRRGSEGKGRAVGGRRASPMRGHRPAAGRCGRRAPRRWHRAAAGSAGRHSSDESARPRFRSSPPRFA